MKTKLYLWRVNPSYAATHADVVFECGGSAWVLTADRVYPLEPQMGVVFDDSGYADVVTKVCDSQNYELEVIDKGAFADVEYLLETQKGKYS